MSLFTPYVDCKMKEVVCNNDSKKLNRLSSIFFFFLLMKGFQSNLFLRKFLVIHLVILETTAISILEDLESTWTYSFQPAFWSFDIS